MGNEIIEDRKQPMTLETLFVYAPLGLIAVGGAIGGGCGGLAAAMNHAIMKSSRSVGIRHVLYLATFTGAVIGYFVLIALFAMLFPNLFAGS